MFKYSNICPFVEMLPSKICHLYEIFLFLIVMMIRDDNFVLDLS